MFKIGQEVVCITKVWKNREEGVVLDGPKFGEICTIEGFHHIHPEYLNLRGYDGMAPAKTRRAYRNTHFRPVVKSHKGMEVLREILINPKVKIKEDA